MSRQQTSIRKGQSYKKEFWTMSIQPQGEDLRKAVKWISEERKFNPNKKIKALIEEACIQFDLSPLIADFLQRKMLEEKTDSNLT